VKGSPANLSGVKGDSAYFRLNFSKWGTLLLVKNPSTIQYKKHAKKSNGIFSLLILILIQLSDTIAIQYNLGSF
jgi:hypothetical protein